MRWRTQSSRNEGGDVDVVISVAGLLVGCGELRGDATVDLDAESVRVDDVRCAARLFPRAWFSGGPSRFLGSDLPEDAGVLTSCCR